MPEAWHTPSKQPSYNDSVMTYLEKVVLPVFSKMSLETEKEGKERKRRPGEALAASCPLTRVPLWWPRVFLQPVRTVNSQEPRAGSWGAAEFEVRRYRAAWRFSWKEGDRKWPRA